MGRTSEDEQLSAMEGTEPSLFEIPLDIDNVRQARQLREMPVPVDGQ